MTQEELLASLEAKIEKLEAHQAIQELKAAYFTAWDSLLLSHGDGAEVVSLFTEDAKLDLGELAGCHEGKANIQECYKKLARRSGRIPRCTKHMGMNPVIKVDGNTATGTWQLVWLAEDPKGNCLWSLNHYQDTYEKGADGQWRFSSLTLLTERDPGHMVVYCDEVAA